jgi:hypothetical protein
VTRTWFRDLETDRPYSGTIRAVIEIVCALMIRLVSE